MLLSPILKNHPSGYHYQPNQQFSFAGQPPINHSLQYTQAPGSFSAPVGRGSIAPPQQPSGVRPTQAPRPQGDQFASGSRQPPAVTGRFGPTPPRPPQRSSGVCPPVLLSIPPCDTSSHSVDALDVLTPGLGVHQQLAHYPSVFAIPASQTGPSQIASRNYGLGQAACAETLSSDLAQQPEQPVMHSCLPVSTLHHEPPRQHHSSHMLVAPSPENGTPVFDFMGLTAERDAQTPTWQSLCDTPVDTSGISSLPKAVRHLSHILPCEPSGACLQSSRS